MRADAHLIQEVLDVIRGTPGLCTSQVIARFDAQPRDRIEDVIWELWSECKIQIDPDSTLRIPREGEKVFRHFAP